MWKCLDSGLYSLDFPIQRDILSSFSLPKPNGKIGLFSLIPENVITRESKGIKVYKGRDLEGYRASIVFYPTYISVFVLAPFGNENFTIKHVDENKYEVKNTYSSSSKGWNCGCKQRKNVELREEARPTRDTVPLDLTDFQVGGSVRSYRLVFGLTQAGWATYEQIVHIVSVINLIWIENFAAKFTLDQVDQETILNSSQIFLSNDIGNFTGNFNSIIPGGNYDLGHVIGPGNGGVAFLNAIGNNTIKGGGFTSAPSVTDDQLFVIDYLCHEMGHQFGCNHSFSKNYSDESNNIAQVEPGSGSTIMGYAGITDVDIQDHSDSYFAAVSVYQAVQRINNIPNVGTWVYNEDTYPQINATLTTHSIPPETVFELNAYPSEHSIIPKENVSYSWCGVGTSPIYRTREDNLGYREFPRYSTNLTGSGYRGDNVFIPTTNYQVFNKVTQIRFTHGWSGGSLGSAWSGTINNTSFSFTSTGGGSSTTIIVDIDDINNLYTFMWNLNFTGINSDDWASDLVVEFIDTSGIIQFGIGGYDYVHVAPIFISWTSGMNTNSLSNFQTSTIYDPETFHSKVFRLTLKDHGQTSSTIHSKTLFGITVGSGTKPEITNVLTSEIGLSLLWNQSDTLSKYNADSVHIWISEPGKRIVSEGHFSEENIHIYDYSKIYRIVYNGPNNGTSGLIPWSTLAASYGAQSFKLKIKFYNKSDFLENQKYKLFILRSDELTIPSNIYTHNISPTVTSWNCIDVHSSLQFNIISPNQHYFLDWDHSGDITVSDSKLIVSHIAGNSSNPPTGVLLFAGTVYSENGIWKGLNGNGLIYTFSVLDIEFQLEILSVHAICTVSKTGTTIEVVKMIKT